MYENEYTERYRLGIEPETQVCLNCKHFHRHYIKDMSPLHCGHCSYPRLKNREILDTCVHFEISQKREGN